MGEYKLQKGNNLDDRKKEKGATVGPVQPVMPCNPESEDEVEEETNLDK